MKLKENKEVVKTFLTEYPLTRDNHKRLQNMIWKYELDKIGLSSMDITAYYFMELLQNKQLSNPESISRVRRKLQEDNPELRGEMWYKKSIAEIETIHEVVTFNEPIIKQIDKLVDKDGQGNLF